MLILYLLSRSGPPPTPMEMAISVVIGWLVFGGWLWYQLTDPRNRQQKPAATKQNRPQRPPCPPATTQRTARKLVVSRAAKRRK